MKRETFFKTLICAWFVAFVFCLGAQAARAQNVQPYVDCVERERDNAGALTGKYIAHFGYINYGTNQVFIPAGSLTNFFSPVRNPPGQPNFFQPGVHPRAVSVTLDLNVSETWRLSGNQVTASFSENDSCGSDGANARLMTYQGRLSDGGATANGVYDLQFRLFNQATGGEARTSLMTVEDVAVANGIFTVRLNLGDGVPSNANGSNRFYNPAILEGEDGFFEIGARPGNSPANAPFTVLTPRQPLTAVPLAMRANTANNAFRAAFADQAKGVALPTVSGTPPATDCNDTSERGRQAFDVSNLRLYICTLDGWRFVTLQTP